MVLIISYSGGSVNEVIDWLDSKGTVVHRLNPYLDQIDLKEIQLTNNKTDIQLHFKNRNITSLLSDYESVWIWHGNLKLNNSIPRPLNNENCEAIKRIEVSLKNHSSILINYLAVYTMHLPVTVIGNYKLQDLNKLEVLFKAKMFGITIPDSYIISRKSRLIEVLKEKEIITKPYHEVAFPVYENQTYQNYTAEISIDALKETEEEFYPTLFQSKIDKIFEIRTLYLLGKFYSMAIFSQQSTKTKLDFRNYNFEKPNRTVAVNLPIEIERKLDKLMNSLNLNMGAIDLIYTSENEYVFLEINPIGQFGMISTPCNYYLEKLITNHLIKKNGN